MLKLLTTFVLVAIMSLIMAVSVFANPSAVRVEADNPDLLPLRVVAEALGFDVGWVNETRTVVIEKDAAVLHIQIDQPLPGGFGVPTIIYDRVFVPAEFIIAEFSVELYWDEAEQAVFLTLVPVELPVIPVPTFEDIADTEEIYDAEEVEAIEEDVVEETEEVVTEEYAGTADPFELLERSQDAIMAAGSVLMNMEMEMLMYLETLLLGGATISSEMAVVVRSETDFDMRTEMTMSMDLAFAEDEALSVITIAYLRDGYMYTDMMGIQTKMALPLDDMHFMDHAGLASFTEEAIIAQSVAADKSRLNFLLSGEVMTNLVDGLVGDMLGDIDLAITIGNASLTVFLDEDGQLTHMNMDFTISMEVDGTTLSARITSVTEIVQVGGVTVEFPDNLDEFEEIDLSQL